jgi:hypothetical protein
MVIPRVKSQKHIGVILDESLTYENYINNTIEKCNHPLKALTSSVQSKHLERIYQFFILPHLEYSSIIFDAAGKSQLAKLDKKHYRASLLVSGCIHGTSACKILHHLGWMSLQDRRNEKKAMLAYDFHNNQLPSYVSENLRCIVRNNPQISYES